jgi:hypothetical protein
VIISTGLRQETNVATARDGSPWASREPTVVDPPGAQRPPSKSKYAEYAEYVGLRYAQYAEYIYREELLALLAPDAPNTFTWGIGN